MNAHSSCTISRGMTCCWFLAIGFILGIYGKVFFEVLFYFLLLKLLSRFAKELYSARLIVFASALKRSISIILGKFSISSLETFFIRILRFIWVSVCFCLNSIHFLFEVLFKHFVFLLLFSLRYWRFSFLDLHKVKNKICRFTINHFFNAGSIDILFLFHFKIQISKIIGIGYNIHSLSFRWKSESD